MEEVKKSSPRSFRLDEETNQRVKSIMEQHKYSHQELFDVLLQSYVESNIKDSLGDRQKEIDNFETYLAMIKSLYLTSLNDNKNVTEKVKNEFQDLLSSKDMLLIELQDKLKQYQGRMELAESESKKFKEEVERYCNTVTTLENKLNETIERYEHELQEKEKVNSAITEAHSSIKKQFEDVKAAQIENQQIRADMAKIEASKRELENRLDKAELIREKDLLEQEKKHQEEINQYQERYLKLLEEMKSKQTSNRSSRTNKKSEQESIEK